MYFRSKKTFDKYNKYKEEKGADKQCRFCDEMSPEKKYSFKYWKILHNDFPYDLLTKKHDMIVPKRHFKTEDKMTQEERDELIKIKSRVISRWEEYDSMMENFAPARSMEHYHIHLMKFRGA
jgi:diadenosine tetraphosphate (Ap4A) HIT family hydrolase